MRIYHLIEQWLAMGNEVTYWAVTSEPERAPWPSPSGRLRVLRSRAAARDRRIQKIAAMISQYPEEAWSRGPGRAPETPTPHRYDVAVLMQAHVGRYAPLLAKVGIPTILDCQNVEGLAAAQIAKVAPTRLSRFRLSVDARKWRGYEGSLARRMDLLVTVSRQDADVFRSMASGVDVVVHPNGADVANLPLQDHRSNRSNRLLMTGTFGYLPNVDAAMWMIRDILPEIAIRTSPVRLDLVGAAPPTWLVREEGETIAVHGEVPDILPFYAQSDVFVAPLRAGGGTRLKILEAFALGIPVVSTTIGCTGLGVEDGRHLLIADEGAHFARSVDRLLHDDGLRTQLIAAGRALVETRFDWRQIATAYEQDLRATVERHRNRRS